MTKPFASQPSRRAVLQSGAAGMALLAAGQQVLAQGTPKRGGILSFALAAEPPTYDLHGSQTFAVMQRVAPHYSTLLRYKGGAYPDVVGDLAESWSSAPDGMSHTFKLRSGVLFHDGTTMTSADVKASYERIRNPPKGVVSSRQASLSKVASIEAPDPQTVIFKMSAVSSSFIDEVAASPWNAIYSAARLEKDPAFPIRNIMGTGAFEFVEHVAGSHWVGKRFEKYFRQGYPFLDGFRAITMAPAATVNALIGKQVQAEFRGFSPAERDRLTKGMGTSAKVEEGGWLLHQDISFNPKRKPFDDPRVRRALSLAIDRWTASRSLGRISVLRDIGGVMMPGGQWAATEAELEKLPGFGKDMAANRAEARRLLKEAGAENLKVQLLNRAIEPYITAGIYLIDQWRQIGVTVENYDAETAAWYASIAGDNFDVVMDSYTDYTDDPTTGLPKFLSADKWPIAAPKFNDPELDDLYARQGAANDKAERRKLVRAFEARTMEQAYTVPILWWRRIVVMQDAVKGWTMSPTHMLYQDLSEVWLA
jgi:peptide/nickel transport system substrate-binding protein